VVKRYLGGKTTNANSTADDGGVFNLFWSNVNILKAALYAKQPRADVSRRHKDWSDDVARVGGLIIERIQRGLINLKEATNSHLLIAVMHRQQDRLLRGLGLAPGPMRQKAVVAEDPQMGVERLDPLFRGGLHDHSPAALERFFDQSRQHALKRLALQVIE